MLKTLKSILPIHPFFSRIFTNSYELHGFSLQNYTQKVKVKKVKRRELKVLANYEILYRNHYLLIKRREGAAGDWEWLFFLLVQECKSWAWRIAGKPFSSVQSALLLTFFFFSQKEGVWFNFILPVNEGWFRFLLFKCISCDAHIYLFWTKVKNFLSYSLF